MRVDEAPKVYILPWACHAQLDRGAGVGAGRAAERLQEEANKRGPRAQIKATTIHRLLNYRSWSQRRQGQEKDSSEVLILPSTQCTSCLKRRPCQAELRQRHR